MAAQTSRARSSYVKKAPITGRTKRNPVHEFQLRYRPYQIQPFVIAPVWPGETMENMLLQSRVIMDPVKNPILGYWNEHYFFYVKLSQLADGDTFKNMLLTNATTAPLKAVAADASTYNNVGGIDYTRRALDTITKWYFRNEDETVLQGAIDGLPMAKASVPGWMQSAQSATLLGEAEHEFPGENTVVPPHMSAFSDHYTAWEAMVSIGATKLDFQDWLASHGVDIPMEERQSNKDKPELVRYVREWAYPTATTDSTGAAAVAPQWSVAQRADKDRFFKEPGFIVGVTCTRPKAYFSVQGASLAHYMNDAFGWLPANLKSEAYTGLKKFTGGGAGVGPLAGNMTNDYWVDMRDLALHGDQFINFARNATDAGLVGLPTAGFNKSYPLAADIDALFKLPAANKVYADGIVKFTILGDKQDVTP